MSQQAPNTYSAMRVEQNARDAKRLTKIADHAYHLASIQRLNLKPLNQRLLWAEWNFHKAIAYYYGEDIGGNFQAACDNLGVDEEGEPV